MKVDVDLFPGLNYVEMRADFTSVESEDVPLSHEAPFSLAFASNLWLQPEVLRLKKLRVLYVNATRTPRSYCHFEITAVTSQNFFLVWKISKSELIAKDSLCNHLIGDSG